VREAEGKQWAEQVERHFGFLARYGFALTDIDASTWWQVQVTYRSPQSAVAVIRSVEFQRVEVQLMRLVDGELPEYPIFVVDSVPVNTFYADDLLGLRLDGADGVLASQHGLGPQEVEAQLAFWSEVLRDYGGDLLAGDLSVLDELEQTVRDRARQHPRRWSSGFPKAPPPTKRHTPSTTPGPPFLRVSQSLLGVTVKRPAAGLEQRPATAAVAEPSQPPTAR
jgi:hypothetical protein